MITSKFPSRVEGDGCSANIVNTIVRNAPSQKKFRFIGRLTVANAAIDAKCFGGRRYVAAVQKVPLISPASATDQGVGFESYNESLNTSLFTREQQARQSRVSGSLIGKGKFNKGGYLMKTTTKSKCRIPVLLSILCAGFLATFLGGCAESPYVVQHRLLSDRILQRILVL